MEEQTIDAQETRDILKQAVRELIFQGDPLLRQNLQQHAQILHSTEFPTQVFHLNGTKYIRINSKDIQAFGDDTEQFTTDLLKLMLSIEDYSSTDEKIDEELPDKAEVIEEAIETYKNLTGEDLAESELIEMDEFRNYIGEDKVPLQPKIFKVMKTEEEQEEQDQQEESEVTDDGAGDGSCDNITAETDKLAKAVGMAPTDDTGDTDDSEQEARVHVPGMEEAEQALEQVQQVPERSRFHSNQSVLSKQEIVALNQKTKKLIKAFRGQRSKQKVMTPRKHLNAKGLAMDSDRIYIDRKAPNGKHIKFNLLIDMSGSMHGYPVKNAVSLIYLFNKLAQEGYVEGSVIYSETRKHYKLDMPVKDTEVLAINRTGSSEGLANTIRNYRDTLANTNLICITDGDIVDEPIDKQFWLKNKIVSTGVYINPHLENVLDYTGKLDKWFTHSLVRQNLDDLIELLIRIGLKG